MNKDSNTILQYKGYLNTPLLWSGSSLNGIKQFDPPLKKVPLYNRGPNPNLRLGKLIEKFVSHELSNQESISILYENVQIIENKLTLGEIDCILKLEEELYHIEVVYKFYLYDESASTLELNRWIGPNRKDSLIQKLTKLKDKQLPILFHNETARVFEKLNIETPSNQGVFFKAQLFVPIQSLGKKLSLINNKCITGFYLRFNELDLLKDSSFYIPTKLNWLTEPFPEVEWYTIEEFKDQVTLALENKKSPLCWQKDRNGVLKKFFVVWWD